jgi:hypothetical protein
MVLHAVSVAVEKQATIIRAIKRFIEFSFARGVGNTGDETASAREAGVESAPRHRRGSAIVQAATAVPRRGTPGGAAFGSRLEPGG